MFFVQHMLEQVDPDDHVLAAFIERMLPGLLTQFASMSAKGGDHRRDQTLSEETRSKFEEKDDQSMVSHLLNGIFPALRLMNILEAENLALDPYSETMRQVYIVSYLMHDVDKIMRQDPARLGMEHKVATWTREHIDATKEVIAGYLRLCGVEAFFPDYADYLEDITYLVVNTQQQWETHLHTHLWRFGLRESEVLHLRRFCTYSDAIAYFVPFPSSILLDSETQKLRTILAELSRDQLVFSYHQIREVRGLLTNIINTGLIHLHTTDQQGIWPYLFFADGVVYIKRKTLQPTIGVEQIVEAVEAQLRQIGAGVIKSQAPGFKFSIQGIAKHPGYYYEFLSLEDYLELLARFTISRTTNDVSATPLQKLRQMREIGEIAVEIPPDILPDVRIGMVGRFLSVVFSTVLGMLDKSQQLVRKQVEQAVAQHLELTPYWEDARTIPNKGGVEYRWFWLAVCFLRDHPGLDPLVGEPSLQSIFSSTLQIVLQLAGKQLREQMPRSYLAHLRPYLESIVELPLSTQREQMLPDFRAEMQRYVKAKDAKRGRELLCTLCNSAYPTEEQSDNAVIFQPWVYKNKLSLYAGKNAGGICTLCALELMLRQILLKGQLRLTGSKFEALKTKYISVYPNYFFTRETGALVNSVLDQLNDVNFFAVRRSIERKDITVEDIMQLDVFAARHQESMPLQEKDLLGDDDDDSDEDDADSDEADEKAESSEITALPERSYIKFQRSEFPGLFMFGMRGGKGDTDSATWAMPAFLALALPLVTGTKVVVSEMVLPLFASGKEFRETVVFDAPHPYLQQLLTEKRVRVNQVLTTLRLLTSIYSVNIDTYAKQGKPEWKHLSEIAHDLLTDPLYLFSYLRKQQRGDSFYASEAETYLHIYQHILEADLGKIQHCVDSYAVFYRGGYQSHSILKPIDIVARAIINSPINIDPDDLLWQMRGELKSWLDRVRGRQATGWAVFRGKDIDTQEIPAIEQFVRIFYDEVFGDYCQGERGLLRGRINRFKDGCEAYYTANYKQRQDQQEAASETDETIEAESEPEMALEVR